MAAHRQVLLFLAVVFAVASLASATEWKVGDDGGWRAQFNKTGWADGKTFRVGDTLRKQARPCCLFIFSQKSVHVYTVADRRLGLLLRFLACSVQVHQGQPHGDPGRQGGLRGVQREDQQQARRLVLRQRRRPPRQARQDVVLLQHQRPLQQRHEARHQRRRRRRRPGPGPGAAGSAAVVRPRHGLHGRRRGRRGRRRGRGGARVLGRLHKDRYMTSFRVWSGHFFFLFGELPSFGFTCTAAMTRV
jgi:hypothetical protein